LGDVKSQDVARAQKITITPVFGLPQPPMDDNDDFSSKDLPFEVWPGVYLAYIHEQMENTDFSLWAREYLSKEDVKKIQAWQYALVNYYDEEQYLHGDSEALSRELVHRIFIGLRIVRPSSVPYQYLHAQIGPDGGFEPSGFMRAEMRLTVFPCDSWAPVRRKDAEMLKAIVPALLEAYKTDCQPVIRAMRILEVGYISEFPDVKQLMWAIGLESLFTSDKHSGAQLAIRRIRQFLGSKTRVYEQSDFQRHVSVPALTLKNVLGDIYDVRNKLAHGEWIPKEYLDKPGYPRGARSYGDILLEATGIILRLALIKILRESLLETFGSKDNLDRHFSP
jgi:hypothetical protein